MAFQRGHFVCRRLAALEEELHNGELLRGSEAERRERGRKRECLGPWLRRERCRLLHARALDDHTC